jgi:endoglucanase
MKILTVVLLALALGGCVSSDGASGGGQSAKAVDYSEKGNVAQVARSAPFSKGVNFSGWFETYSAQSINFTRYTEKDFADVKSLGADVIRLPIRMHSMTLGAPDYRFDPLLLKFLDAAVDWAEKYELYLIIDNHSFDPVVRTDENVDRILLPVWEQIAQRYKDRSDYIVYEILNEPHGISDRRWGEIQGMAIDAIRKHDTKHSIIVGGTDYNSIGKMPSIPKYKDDKLIYTFHFYDPHLFSHQGATWGEPSMAPLRDLPFPYDRSRMPKFPSELRGTWLEGAFNNYGIDAQPERLYRTLNRVVTFANEANVPVFCGEFGIYMIQSPPEDRALWYKIATDALDRRNISRTSWDYYGGFGIFNEHFGGDFDYDVNVDVVKAMGFTPPPQKTRTIETVKTGFVIFDDYPNKNIVTSGNWGEKSEFSLYDENSFEGEFAIRWGEADQYNAFWFLFNRNDDFTALVEEGYCLEFMARANSSVMFDVRFLNTETASSPPWRIRYTIDDKILPPDGRWHKIQIPLEDMREQGAWIDSKQQWLSPVGDFTWEDIRQLEFVSEHSDMKGKRVWFDNIKIAKD